jgi:hypothetical protein
MTSQPDDGQTFEQSASQRPVASTSDADHAVTSSPPLDIPFHMNSIWPLLKSCANALVRVAICSFQPASQPGPGDLECFDMTAPAGSFPVDVRMRDRQVAMRFTASGEPMMVHFTVVKSPIRREQGKGDFPCFISTAPKRGELVCVDTVEMFAVYIHEGDEAVELDPPGDTRYIAVPSLEPVPDHYPLLGIVEAYGRWWRLHCPDLVPPTPMEGAQ